MLGERQPEVFDLLGVQLEQLHAPDAGGLTPLGISGIAGFFLGLLEHDGWTVLIRPALSGQESRAVVEVVRRGIRFRRRGEPATAAIEVYRLARELVVEERTRLLRGAA